MAISTLVGASYIILLSPYAIWCWLKGCRGYHSWTYTLKVSGIASLLSLACRDTWYYSLDQTTDGSNSAIYRTCTGWVYLFSIFFLGEKVDVVKLGSLTIAVLGSVAVAVASNEKEEDGVHKSIIGYVDLLASVLFFAAFQIFVKKFMSHEDDTTPTLTSLRFCGCIGLWILLWGPTSVLFWMLFTTREFTFPPRDVLETTIGIGVLDAIYSASIIICMHLTDPTFTSVATILVVPMTVAADFFIHKYYPSALSAIGTLIVILGCCCFNYRAYKLSQSSDQKTESDDDDDDDEKSHLVDDAINQN
eukprot:TRINITY_DN1326_c2_g1_i1.p1 TRINITY_DN1326_c2_g1~~TRINITY_DN1326_c2_g1_i1.p1  ORF type:complete len:356 (+),score=38.04 TRINITY_DN1326_c2_g1_i1:154-1068(+)